MAEIYKKISAVMAEIGAIGKTHANTQQGYKFRGVDDVYNALQPALIKHGVCIAPQILDAKTLELEQATNNGTRILHKSVLHVRFKFYCEDASFVEADAIGEAVDYSDKASNKSMSVAFKYVCFQVFCIPTVEMFDSDTETIERTPPAKTGAASNRPLAAKSTSASGQQTSNAPKQVGNPNDKPSDAQIGYLRKMIEQKGLSEIDVAQEFSAGREELITGLTKGEASGAINILQKR